LVGRDERTLAKIVEKYEECGRANGEDAALSVRTLRRWMKGQVRTEPRPSQRAVARMFWGYPMSQLLAPAPPELVLASGTGDPTASGPTGVTGPAGAATAPVFTTEPDGSANTLERQVAMATRRAARFTTFAEIDNVGPEAIAQLQDDVVHLANAYIHDPLATIMGDLIDEQEI